VGGYDASLRLTGPQPALLYLAPSCVSSVLVASWRQVAHTKSHQCIQYPTRRFNRLGSFARLQEDWSRSWFLPRDSLDPHAELGQSHKVTRALLALQSTNTPLCDRIRLIKCAPGSTTSGDLSAPGVSVCTAGDGDIDAAADDNAADTARLLSR
jgi:hypothetical protein